jgi:flavin reductase (DIM6/NTAB) family NADH-FMN oxidoreductase RutF
MAPPLLPPQAGPLVDGAVLRAALRDHPAGITVITAPGPVGFTATSFTPVSLEPPLVTFFLGVGASTRPAVEAAQHFAVHLLDSTHVPLASGFARSGIDRFAGWDWSEGPAGVPVLDGAAARLHCRVTLRQRLGDHVQVVGEVLEVHGRGATSGLVHHRGEIHGLPAVALQETRRAS